jgi:ankyrin repeat protein
MTSQMAGYLINVYSGRTFIENILVYAAANNYLALVQKIVHHSDFNNQSASIALIHACHKGNSTIAALLISRGANVEFDYNACIEMASKFGYTECAGKYMLR